MGRRHSLTLPRALWPPIPTINSHHLSTLTYTTHHLPSLPWPGTGAQVGEVGGGKGSVG